MASDPSTARRPIIQGPPGLVRASLRSFMCRARTTRRHQLSQREGRRGRLQRHEADTLTYWPHGLRHSWHHHAARRPTALVGADLPYSLVIASVDSCQWRAAYLIVLSTVRSGRDGIGFVGDYRRLSVALARAKFGLILFGNYYTLTHCGQGRCWTSCLEHIRGHGLLLNEHLQSWNQQGGCHAAPSATGQEVQHRPQARRRRQCGTRPGPIPFGPSHVGESHGVMRTART